MHRSFYRELFSFTFFLLSPGTVFRADSSFTDPTDCLLAFSHVAAIFFLASLSLAAVSDLRHRSVPAHLERACFFFAAAASYEKALSLFALKLSGSAFCFILFFSLYVTTKGRGLGGADVRIFAGSCAVLGFFPTFEALLIGLCLGVVYALTSPRIPNTPKATIPLVSFFTLGCFVSKILSSLILHTYF